MIKYTLQEMEQHHAYQLVKLVEHAGDIQHLARMLDVSDQTTRAWYARGRISKKGARSVEKHPTLSKKFKAIELRLDLNP